MHARQYFSQDTVNPETLLDAGFRAGTALAQTVRRAVESRHEQNLWVSTMVNEYLYATVRPDGSVTYHTRER